MPAKMLRTAVAVAFAVPLVLAVGQSPAGAYDYPAENDCTGPYGAVTSQPGPDYDCYGIDNDRRSNRNGGGDGRYYRNGTYYGENGPYGGSAPQYYPGPYGPW